jgi:fluoride ion exporter CrcB/FEX
VPYGTLAANLGGTAVYGMATVLMLGTAPAAGGDACTVLGAVTNGFAGTRRPILSPSYPGCS